MKRQFSFRYRAYILLNLLQRDRKEAGETMAAGEWPDLQQVLIRFRLAYPSL